MEECQPTEKNKFQFFPVSKHSDVLTCIETRLSMLSMTYQKYMKNGTACFIPGKVIDECYKILRSISVTDTKNLRAHEILQELRDISSMAIEHFDEKIVPDLKKSRPDDNASISSIYDILASAPRISGPSFEGFLNLSRSSSNNSISPIHDTIVRNKSKLSSVVSMYKKHSKIIKSQTKQIGKMVKSLNKLKRRLDESETKNRELTESIKHLKSTNKLPAAEEPGPPPKKRTATLVLKRRLDKWSSYEFSLDWTNKYFSP